MRGRAFGLCALLVLLGTAGCGGDPSGPEDDLRAAMRRTQRLSRAFVYGESAGQRRVTVEGIVEDDYRYKARVAINGSLVADEVGVDDALAVRFTDESAFDVFVAKGGATTVAGTTGGAAPSAPAPASVPAATPSGAAGSGQAEELLRARHWVLDPVGAPDLVGEGATQRRVGDDPVLDALTVLAYVEDIISQSAGVSVFNPEALDYIAREDRFPKPDKKSGVERYDIRPQRLVRPSQTVGGGGLPDVVNFRKVSVYVKDGRVLQVLEDVDIESRAERLVDVLDLKLSKALPPPQLAARAIAQLNAQRAAQGNAPIRVRRMSFELLDVGKEHSVELPDVTSEASLSLLRNRGVVVPAATAPA